MPTDQQPDENTSIHAIRQRLDGILLKGAGPEEAAQALIDACLACEPVEMAWVWTRRDSRSGLNLEAVGQVSPEIIDHLLHLPDQPRMLNLLESGCALEEGGGTVPDDAATELRCAGMENVLVWPALMDGQLETAVGVSWRGPDSLDEGTREIIAHGAQLFGHLHHMQRLENHLARLQDNAAQIFRGIDDALFIVDTDGSVVATNYQLNGQGDGESLDDMLPGGSAILQRYRESVIPGLAHDDEVLNQSRLRIGEGHLRPVEVTIREIRWNDDQAYLLTCRDITNRLVIEKERARLSTAIEQTADAVVITNSSGSILYTNPAFTKLTGFTAEEAYGANPRILKSEEQSPSFYRDMWSTIHRGETWKGRLVNRRKDGDLYWEVGTISPVRDPSGVITHFVCVKRDITREVKLEEKWRQSQKLEAIGTLAGGIAHDFNNILYALLGNAHLALDDIPADHPAFLPLQEIVKAGDRGASLVNKMLAFGQRTEGHQETRALQPIIREAMDLVRASLPSTMEIKLELPDEAAYATVDDTQIHQVILNLFNNAAHAMEGHGVCTLTLDTVSIREGASPANGSLVAGEYLRLIIRDTGMGMEKGLLNRIFEPYFTTKKPNEGTGLGLASVHGIVHNHGGHIAVESEVGVGTIFTIHLPRVARAQNTEDEPAPIPDEVRGGGRILMIDDEQMILDVVTRGMTKSGFEVTAFLDGVKALEHFRNDPDAFDVVLTDQTMPNITGFELAAQISSIRPDLPIILSTGYADTMEEGDLHTAGISHFLHKPLKIKDLARLMGEICQPTVTLQGD